MCIRDRLGAALTRLTLDATSSERRTSAIAVRDLLTALQGQRPDGIVRALAEAAVPTTVTAMGEVLAVSYTHLPLPTSDLV